MKQNQSQSKIIIAIIVSISLWAILVFSYYHVAQEALWNEIRQHLITIAQCAALTINPQLHQQVWQEKQSSTPLYKKKIEHLRQIATALLPESQKKKHTMSSESIYTLIPSKGNIWHFVLDSDYDRDKATAAQLREPYDISNIPEIRLCYEKGQPTASLKIYQDKWSKWLSGFAPLRDNQGRIVAIIGADMNVMTIIAKEALLQKTAWLIFAILTTLTLFVGLLFFRLQATTKKLIEAKDLAETANRAKSQFFANMNHELRTPLTIIIGYAELLADEINPEQANQLNEIVNSAKYLHQLINDILDLAKIESGHMEIKYSEFNIVSTLMDMESIVRILADKKNITLSMNIADNLSIILADEVKLKQILYNLMNNAIKYTPEGGRIDITAKMIEGKELQNIKAAALSSSLFADTSFLMIAVSDTGIGIKLKDQKDVFSEYKRLNDSYTLSQQGTGLGLPLTKRIVELHDGTIWVESEGAGKGSTFIFAIPVKT